MILTTRLAAGTYPDLDEWTAAVRRLDAAGLDSLVVAGAGDGRPTRFEPTTLASYLGQQTTTIGLVPEETALHGQPYHVARRLATLDHLTGGRSGWSLQAHGMPTEHRGYEWASPSAEVDRLRAAEFAEIVLELWDSWEEGAEVPDKRRGDFHDDSRIHAIDYRSTSFLVRGPLDVPRTPQGRPVVQVDVRGVDDAQLASIFADVVVVRADSLDRVLALTKAVRDAVVESDRTGEVRILMAVSDLDRPGCVAVSAEADEAIAQVTEMVAAVSADGLEIASDGSPESLAWLADGLAPTLGSGRANAGRTLLGRWDLDTIARFGRRAA